MTGSRRDDERASAGAAAEEDATARSATPPEDASSTFSYGDALLTGLITRTELEAVRAEFFGGQAAIAAPTGGASDADAVEAPWIGGIQQRLEMEDYGGALQVAERFLDEVPGSAPAQYYAHLCGKLLVRVYVAHLGGEGQLVRRGASAGPAARARAGAAVLACIETDTSVGDVLARTELARLDALRALWDLVQEGTLELVSAADP